MLTAAEMRAAEQACGVPLGDLMEQSGAALAEAAWRFGGGRPVLVLCGPGNNGGDGYVAARLLAGMGLDVRVATLGAPATALAKAARARWTGGAVALGEATAAPVMIDALFGTGLSRRIDGDTGTLLWTLYAQTDLIIAADLPSGVGTDDGSDLGAIPADVTVALGALKPAHLLQPAAARCGHILIADTGIDREVVGSLGINSRPMLAAPAAADHKYTRGMVAVVAGDMAGAATLGVTAAARCAGYTVLVGKGDAPASVVRRGVGAVLADPKLGAMLIGPGLADSPANREKLGAALASTVPLVLDAGALALVTAGGLQRAAATILTPHAGEFDRLFGRGSGSKVDRVQQAASASGATVVFKGSDTVIASPDGRVTLCPPASPWLASAGTGDVLAGIMAAMLARGRDAHDAACAAVWLHGEAARRAGPGLIADDLAVHLPAALAACT